MNPRATLLNAAIGAVFSLGLVGACSARPDSAPLGRSRAAQTATQTLVTLTFDDALADQYQVGAMLAERGLAATFFVPSGRLGESGYLTRDQLALLEESGNEIGGHTVEHVDLTTLDPDEARREVCNDRVALLGLGLPVTSLAYPFGHTNALVESIVSDCGYNSARIVGGLVSPGACDGCPFANAVPPPDPYDVRTPDSVKQDTTLATMKGFVTQAERNGGGWVPIVMHHVCDGCNPYAVSPSTLSSFLDWLAARASKGTIVRTMQEVIGGPVQPPVNGPPPPTRAPGSNLLLNPSLELDSDGDGVPDCWQRGGWGDNGYLWALVGDAHDGTVGERLTMTSWSSGVRRLVSRQDLGACAPPASPGHAYDFSAFYHASTTVQLVAYYRNTSGGWVWWAQSPILPAVATYTQAHWTVPALPADATALSVGLGILNVGSVTMDSFALYETDDQPPTNVAILTPADGASVTGIAPINATATDDVGVYRIRFFLDGRQLGTRTKLPWRWNWDTTTTTKGAHTLQVEADDFAGNATRSPTIGVTVY